MKHINNNTKWDEKDTYLVMFIHIMTRRVFEDALFTFQVSTQHLIILLY